jgi:hypothetical protein
MSEASTRGDTIAWLLDSDPAIRWQTLRDLTNAAPAALAAERARIPREGIGAAILACQGSDGAWHRADAPEWLPTLFTFQLLRATGVDPADPAVDAAVTHLESGFRWHEAFGKKPFFEGEVEPCINGGALALGAYFRRPTASLADRLVSEQLDDGGWNCERRKAHARRTTRRSACSKGCSSMSVPLVPRPRSRPPDSAAKRICSSVGVPAALDRRGRASRIPDLRVSATVPLRRAKSARLFPSQRAEPDPRMSDAMRIVDSRQQADGRWLLDRSHDEAIAVPLGESVGGPSRWITLRALRVRRWYERAQGEL